MSVFRKHPSLRQLRPLGVSGAFLAGSGLLLAGCPSGADLENADQQVEAHSQVEGPPGTYCDATDILETSCGLFSGCHMPEGDATLAGGTDLITPGIGARLVGVTPAYPNLPDCAATPKFLIDPGNLEQSYLWQKLTRTHETPACGDFMPIGAALNTTQMNCVWDWMKGLVAGVDPSVGETGTGGAAGTGGNSGTGGDAAGTGGDAAGTGGDAAGTGGDAAGTGGAVSSADPIRVEAECVFEMGCADGVMGSYTEGGEGPQLEDSQIAVGYMEAGVALIFEGIPATGLDTLTLSYAQNGGDGVIEVRQDTATGTLLGTVTPTDTGDWAVFEESTITLSAPLTGTTTIVLVPVPDVGPYVANVDWFELSAGSAQ